MIDLSYKNGAPRYTYDIEILPDIFTFFAIGPNKILLILYLEGGQKISEQQISDCLAKFVNEPGVKQATGLDKPVVETHILYPDSNMFDFSMFVTKFINCNNWQPANSSTITEWAGWNSDHYDLPMMAVARYLLGNKLFSAKNLKQISDLLINLDCKPWRIWEEIENQTCGLVWANKIKAIINRAKWCDGHIDWAKLCRAQDGGEEAKFPPGLKKEMAKAGLDIVIDENVSTNDYSTLSVPEILELVEYNANDVLGTFLVSQNQVLQAALKTRDTVRRMYPYTSAKNVSLEKINKYTPPERDTTTASLAGLMLIGEKRVRPMDYRVVSYDFPLPSGKTDLLEYMKEHEKNMHPFVYEFFDHWRGNNTRDRYDEYRLKNSQPITHSAQMNMPYYHGDAPSDAYIRFSTGGAHGSIRAGLSGMSAEEVENWIRSDADSTGSNKPTIDCQNVIHLDWSSFYPTMASKMGLYMTKENVDRYTEIIKYRIDLKKRLPFDRTTWGDAEHALNEEQDALKLILNSATGAGNMHNPYALLPVDNKTLSMRLIGNMFIWCLGQRLASEGAFIISTNTDGLYVTNIELDKVNQIVDDYVAEYGMGVEPEIVDRFINRDTSNRVEFTHGEITSVRGRLRHGARLTYGDDTLGRNIQYPLAAGYAVLEYMKDPEWLVKPYDRSIMESIIDNIFAQNLGPEPWYNIHAGSKARRLTKNGEKLGKINRVVLTTDATGGELGTIQSRKVTKSETVQILHQMALSHSNNLDQVCEDLGFDPANDDPENQQIVVVYKHKNKGGEIEQLTGLIESAVETGELVKGELGVYNSQTSQVDQLKIWKDGVITGYPSHWGTVLNTRSDLEEFNLDWIDRAAYVRWAELLLETWKITNNIPELGMQKMDDRVGDPGETSGSQTRKVEKILEEKQKITQLYTNLDKIK